MSIDINCIKFISKRIICVANDELIKLIEIKEEKINTNSDML